MAAAVREQIFASSRPIDDYECHHFLAQTAGRTPHRCDIGYRRMQQERAFNEFGIDIDAAADDHVRSSAHEVEVPTVVEPGDVPRSVPLVSECNRLAVDGKKSHGK